MLALHVFFALFFIACAGCGAAALALPKRDGVGTPEFFGISVLLGGAIISLATFLGGFFFLNPVLSWIVAALALVFAALGFLTTRQKFSLIWPATEGKSGACFFTILVLQITVVAWQTIVQTLRWDGLFSWTIKAQIAWASGGRLPFSYFLDASRAWSHPHYPPALPLLEEWLYAWIGAPHQGLTKILFLPVYPAALAFLWTGVKKITGDSRHAWAAATLPFFVPCLVVGPGSASSGWADFPLATVYLAAVVYLLDYARTGARSSLRCLAICAALLPWVKQEGVILAGCLFLIGLIAARPRREIFPMLAATIPTLLVVCGWKVFLAAMQTPSQNDFLPFTSATLWENGDRLAVVAKFAAGEIVNWSRWGALWIVALFALGILARRADREGPALILTAAILLPIALYSGIYIFSAWPNVHAHISTSLPRLIMDVALVAVLAIGLALPLPPRGEIIPRRA